MRALIEQERPVSRENGLRSLGLRVISGKANYLLFRAPNKLGEKMEKRGVALRGCGNYPGLDDTWYRTAVRTRAENDISAEYFAGGAFMSRAKKIMIQGTMSGAGKSLLCAALCRIFAQDGYKVAPFKSQNMALNSFVTRDGLEMGRAQVVQAQAAGIEPDVRMNPILLKPSSDTGSQVIVNGEVRGHMSAAAYFQNEAAVNPGHNGGVRQPEQ